MATRYSWNSFPTAFQVVDFASERSRLRLQTPAAAAAGPSIFAASRMMATRRISLMALSSNSFAVQLGQLLRALRLLVEVGENANFPQPTALPGFDRQHDLFQSLRRAVDRKS